MGIMEILEHYQKLNNMKFVFIIFLILFVTIQQCGTISTPQYNCNNLIQTIFNEKFFYTPKPGQLNLTGVDTITILDKSGYFRSLSCPTQGEVFIDTVLLSNGSNYSWSDLDTNIIKVEKKIYRIRNDDDIPTRIKSFRANLEDHDDPRYRCYFLLEEIRINSDSLYIHMEKLISNHRIGLTYIRRGDNWELIDQLVGQY